MAAVAALSLPSVLALSVLALSVLAMSTPATAGNERMTLDCGGDLGVIERTDGASWWGVADDSVYTTKHLRVTDNQGNQFEKHYGHAGREHVVCEAAHDVNGYESVWTVHLVRSR